MFKLALSAGHGIHTAGRRCIKSSDPNETREWALNSRICNLIEEKLRGYEGYELIRVDDRTGEEDVKLVTRTKKANEFGADLYLSIHHNGGVKGGTGGGVIAFVHPSVKDGDITAEWQKYFYNSIVKHTGLKGNRAVPLAKLDLHETRETKMPCVLLECGFMDSVTDVPIIITYSFADKVATAIVEVIVNKAKLIKKEKNSKTTKNETSEEVYTVESGDTLSEIAGKYNTTYQKLAEYNGISNPNIIRVGQKIRIPLETKTNKDGVTENVPKKDLTAVVKAVIKGEYGNGETRKKRLRAEGYSDKEIKDIQNKINEYYNK